MVATATPRFHVKDAWVPEDLHARLRAFNPRTELGAVIRECFRYLPIELTAELLDRITRCVVLESSLSLVVFRPLTEKGRNGPCRVEDLGVVSRKLVTTAGMNFLVDAFQNLTEIELFKYHGIGTGTNAENASDTALQTELTTQYNPNSTRATGNLTEGASANIFHTEGTNTVDGDAAVTEHGVFTQAATGGGTLLDRSIFAAVNLVGASADSLLSKYEFTATAGG